MTAIVTALIFLSGHPGTILHVLALGLALFITRPSSKVLLGLIFGLGLSALLWLPQLAFIIESESLWSRGSNQLHFRTLIDIFWPQIFGHPSSDNYTGLDEWASSQLHIGFPCMYLVVLSLLQRSTRRQSLAIVLGVTFAVLIGVIGLPGPVNHTRLTGLALVVLSVPAALGAQNIRSKVGQLAILVSIVGLSHWTNRLHQEGNPQDTHKPILSEWAKLWLLNWSAIQAKTTADG